MAVPDGARVGVEEPEAEAELHRKMKIEKLVTQLSHCIYSAVLFYAHTHTSLMHVSYDLAAC